MNNELPKAAQAESKKDIPVENIRAKENVMLPENASKDSIQSLIDSLEQKLYRSHAIGGVKQDKMTAIGNEAMMKAKAIKEDMLPLINMMKILNNGGKTSGIEKELIKNLSIKESAKIDLLKGLESDLNVFANLPDISWEERSIQETFRSSLLRSIEESSDGIFDSNPNGAKRIAPFAVEGNSNVFSVDILPLPGHSMVGGNNKASEQRYKSAVWSEKNKEEGQPIRIAIPGHISFTIEQKRGTTEIFIPAGDGKKGQEIYINEGKKEIPGYHRPTVEEKKMIMKVIADSLKDAYDTKVNYNLNHLEDLLENQGLGTDRYEKIKSDLATKIDQLQNIFDVDSGEYKQMRAIVEANMEKTGKSMAA